MSSAAVVWSLATTRSLSVGSHPPRRRYSVSSLSSRVSRLNQMLAHHRLASCRLHRPSAPVLQVDLEDHRRVVTHSAERLVVENAATADSLLKVCGHEDVVVLERLTRVLAPLPVRALLAVVLLPEAIHHAVAVLSALEELEVPVTRPHFFRKSA